MRLSSLQRFILLVAIVACDPIVTPDPDNCTVRPEAFFTNTNQLTFEIDLDQDERVVHSFTLFNDACRVVRFNYLTDVNGPDADAFEVYPPPKGYAPWIKPRDSVEVEVEFSTDQKGELYTGWIEIEYSYPISENMNDVGSMERIYLKGRAFRSTDSD